MEEMVYDGLIKGMGDLVLDGGESGESLYHKGTPQPQPQRQVQQDLGDDQAQTQQAPAAPVVTKKANESPKRGLKTPVLLGVSAGAAAAAGVYGFLRWKHKDQEAPGKLAGVVGGASALAVTLTVLVARGIGALDRGVKK